MKKIFIILVLIQFVHIVYSYDEKYMKLPLNIIKVVAHGDNKSDWSIQAEKYIAGKWKTAFFKIGSQFELNGNTYTVKNISSPEMINGKNIYTVLIQNPTGNIIKAKEKEEIWDIDNSPQLNKPQSFSLTETSNKSSSIYTDGKNEYDLKKSTLTLNVDKSTGRKTGYTPNICDYGRISGEVNQVINNDKIVIKVFDSLLAVNKKGIGIDSVDGQSFDNVIMRTGTYKCTSVFGSNRSIPDCIILVEK